VLVKILLVVSALVLLYILSKAAGKAQVIKAKELLERFRDKKVVSVKSNANFFGQESLGYSQMRGNCSLVITEDEIFSEMWLPKRSFTIPVASIVSIETPKSFLGKSRGRSLLKVVFTNESGLNDSAAWQVRDLSETVELLKTLVK
jgi:hypothetical protein